MEKFLRGFLVGALASDYKIKIDNRQWEIYTFGANYHLYVSKNFSFVHANQTGFKVILLRCIIRSVFVYVFRCGVLDDEL